MTVQNDNSPLLRLVRLANGADLELPSYETRGAAGMDLRAAVPTGEPLTLQPGERALVPTGFIFEVPQGYEAQIRPVPASPSRTASPASTLPARWTAIIAAK